MRFLANENFPDPSIQLLRAAQHDVRSIREEFAGATDEHVIELAQKDDRIILTFDRDYGTLIFKEALSDPPPVVYFRYRGTDPRASGEALIELLKNGTVIVGMFTVVEIDGIRQRRYAEEPS